MRRHPDNLVQSEGDGRGPYATAPASTHDALDVAVFSDQYNDIAGDLVSLNGQPGGPHGYGLSGFDPLTQWSSYGNVDGAARRRWLEPALR